MTLAACAENLRRGDPDRFRVAMAAPVEARARLLPLYAFNLEIARAPWASNEPVVAQMRLQFWRDVLVEIDEGAPASAHEVVAPLAEVMRSGGPTGETLDRMVVARWADVNRDPFETANALGSYLADTNGTLMWATAQALGATPAEEPQLRALGKAAGLAMMLLAAPELGARGWQVLPEDGLDAMIEEARADISAARTHTFSASVPALRAAWRAEGILARAAADPAAIGEGRLAESEFARRARLGWKSLTGRW